MKKFILGLIFALVSIVSASAQVVDNGSAKDNWYLGGGIGTQIWNDQNSWKLFNPWKEQQLNINIFGGKYFTPYIGAELDATALFNTGAESNFIDGHVISLNGVANLSNIIGGYKGLAHKFEVEAIAGPAWYHTYQTGKDYNHSALHGALRASLKVSKNFNVYIMPEYISLWKINDHFKMTPQGVNVYAGVKWNIPTKRSNFPVCRLYDADEVSALSAQIDALKKALDARPVVTNAKATNIQKIITESVNNSYTITFDKGNSSVSDVTTIASALNKVDGVITIIGGASPEGSEAFNSKLATDRAEAVKAALIKAGVSADRIKVASDYANQRRATIIIEK